MAELTQRRDKELSQQQSAWSHCERSPLGKNHARSHFEMLQQGMDRQSDTTPGLLHDGGQNVTGNADVCSPQSRLTTFASDWGQGRLLLM